MSRLSSRMKLQYYPFLIERDGNRCFYCQESFTNETTYEYDHLDNNVKDSRPENLVLCHHHCNVRKKYSQVWQDKALGKLRMNEASKCVCGNENKKLGTHKEQTSSQAISQTNNRIALDYLNELLNTRDILYCKDYADATKNRCFNINGTGSQSAIYRYLDSFTNSINGDFTIYTVHGKKAIRRKN